MSGIAPSRTDGPQASTEALEFGRVDPVTEDVQLRTGIMRSLLRDPAALIALTTLIALVLGSVLAPFIVQSPLTIHPLDTFAGPSRAHLLGTDELGRDLLSRVLNAGRLSLSIAASSTAISLIGGTAWGFIAGLRGGLVDEVLMRLVDAAMAIPLLLFALIFVAALGSAVLTLIFVMGLLMMPFTARVARSAVLSELAMDYYRALRAIGTPRWRILFVEVLPNASPTLLAQASLNLATALMLEASLGFLGLGVQPPQASWGTLLQSGYSQLIRSVWYPLIPAVAIIVAIAACNTLGDRVQHMLDRN